MTNQELIKRAEEMKPRAYAPYSNFPVGAALLCEDGTVFTGCNVENGAYSMSICAERTALVKAVSEGHLQFRAIAVTADTAEYCLPCGACRQMLIEFAPDLDVLCANKDGDYVCYKLHEMLAPAFQLQKRDV